MKVKKYKLKKKYRRIILYLVLGIILVGFGINRYKLYKYHQTYEYKLLSVGYEGDDVSILLKNLDNDYLEKLINEEKIDYIANIIKEKYFMKKNLDRYLSYYASHDDGDFANTIAVVNVGADKEWYEDAIITDMTKGLEILVNKFHLLDKDYDAGVIKKFSATYAYGTVSASEECYNQFISMANAAKKEGITLVLSSGYREYDYQEKLYNNMVKTRGQEYADNYAARVGASEHETGLALDILSTGKGVYTDTFHETEAYAWLIEHASEYGFILRYPDGKEHITGYKPESWHYRYLGVDLAKKVENEGITYDEYYAYYLE